MKIVLVIVVASAMSAGVTALFRPAAGAASSAATYRLRRGDLASIPSLGWTCNVATLPGGRRPAFFCTTNNKPIVSLWFSAHRIFVGVRRPPVRSKNGYAFSY